MKKFAFVILFLSLCFSTLSAKSIYVSTTGIDTNPGTIDLPLKTITKALASSIRSGDSIIVRGGVYSLTTTISINPSGKQDTLCYLLAFPGERPILDFSAMAVSSSNRGIQLKGSYWYLKGLDIKGAGDNGMNVSGSNNIVEFCALYENRDSGMQIGGGASNNKIINCDSYFNRDPAEGNADGFSPKLDVGTNNYFYGCRSWQNSDDGFDGYLRPSDDITTTYENCWCFKNGYRKDGTASTGNGNGFKMGGSDLKTLMHNAILYNCISFDNRAKGFDQNNNKGSMTLINCTAYNNGTNYSVVSALNPGKVLTVTNCLALGPYGTLLSDAVLTTNSWMLSDPVTSSDFISIDTSGVRGARKPDGSLPDITFMHLKSSSHLVDAGTIVPGRPYSGTAPDIGAFEYIFTNLSLTALIQGLTNPATSQMVTDTVACVIKNGSAPFITVDSVKVFLNANGQGTATFSKVSINTNYYIQLRHRNSIETWSNTVTFANSNPTYDFTTSQSQAYGNNLVLVGSKWCLYSGDVNHDGLVDLSDLIAIDNDIAGNVTGYTNTDLNGNGLVDLSDLIIADNNNAAYIVRFVPPGAP
jgi:Right handed beta helix region